MRVASPLVIDKRAVAMTVTEVALHLHAPLSPSHHTYLLLHAKNPIFHLHCRPIFAPGRRFLLLFPQWPLHIRRCRRWDSNAESYSTKNFNSDATGEFKDFDDEMELWVDALEDYIDSIWILKVIMFMKLLYCVYYEI